MGTEPGNPIKTTKLGIAMDMDMTVNGLKATINTPSALLGDRIHALPGHAQVQPYVVDEYPACPDIWEHGSSRAGSYFMSLEAGRGMWFDFTQNRSHKHHVAIVISVQGVNPITGKPITELCLVQHKTKCPVHEVEFQQDRYCPVCKYKWPAQNYIATTTDEVPWLDGFRNENGEVRQYIISAEQARGVAKQIEGKDPEFKRVWAIGFAFYLSKEPKPEPPKQLRSRQSGGICGQSLGFSSSSSNSPSYSSSISADPDDVTTTSPPDDAVYGAEDLDAEEEEHTNYWDHTNDNFNQPSNWSDGSPPDVQSLAADGNLSDKTVHSKRTSKLRKYKSAGIARFGSMESLPQKITTPQKLEVGAGARIKQDVGIDPEPIDFWQEKPAGMIYVNFTGPETLQEILDAGKRQDKAEGPLNDLKVGN